MSKYVLMGMAGYLLGMKHQWMCRHFCLRKMLKRAGKMIRM